MAYTNSFKGPTRVDHRILGPDNKLIGTLRVKPSGVLWRPADVRRFYSVELAKFAEWITADSTGAERTKV
jgi:hypothetical protein